MLTNTNVQARATSSRLETSDLGISTSNMVNDSAVVHGSRTQNIPSVQQLLDNTRITIEESISGNVNNLDVTNESDNGENRMEQYARYLRQQVAEVTRGRFSNIINASRNNHLSRQNGSGLSMQSENINRTRPTSGIHVGLNRISTSQLSQGLVAPNNSIVPSNHSNENSFNNQIMIRFSNHDAEVFTSTILPTRMTPERTPDLSSYSHNNNSDNLNTLSPLNETITSRTQLSDRERNSAVNERATSTGTNSSVDNVSRVTEETATSANELYNTIYPDIFMNTLRQCLHYIPFASILLVKFVYDHFLGLLDIIIIQFVMYYVNKSLQVQVAKIDEKKNSILLRDLSLVIATITIRLLLASTPPDPFGLLIGPPLNERSIVHQIAFNFPQDNNGAVQNQISTTIPTSMEKTVVIPKLISLEAIIYYIAVNDLILKLITISSKLIITLIPLQAVRHKSRTRLYVFIEFFSQFCRSMVPIRQWLLFLFESYSGLHAISGVMFSSAYIVMKGCELADRGKSLKKSFSNLLKDAVDKARKPMQDNLDPADELCAICQDSYVTPVVLECGHIFCDNCVTTWFKREQTCPMCRAKVGDNLAWHDGSTTFFYQLY